MLFSSQISNWARSGTKNFDKFISQSHRINYASSVTNIMSQKDFGTDFGRLNSHTSSVLTNQIARNKLCWFSYSSRFNLHPMARAADCHPL